MNQIKCSTKGCNSIYKTEEHLLTGRGYICPLHTERWKAPQKSGTGVIEDTKEPMSTETNSYVHSMFSETLEKMLFPDGLVKPDGSNIIDMVLGSQVKQIQKFQNYILLREQEAYKKGYIDRGLTHEVTE